MKQIVFVISMLVVSTAAFADGFRCEGNSYRVKLYNRVRPEDGTRNPAALIVSQRGLGTIAVVEHEDLQRDGLENAVVYGGRTNGALDGRFVYAELAVDRRVRTSGDRAGTVDGILRLRANHDNREVDLVCRRYRKGR